MTFLPPAIPDAPEPGTTRVKRRSCRAWLSVFWLVLCLALGGGMWGAVPLQAGTVPEERASAAADADLERLLESFAQAEAVYRAQLEQVDALRRRVATRPREMGQLQEALAEAQATAERLVVLELDVRAARRVAEERRVTARSALERALTEAEGDPTRVAAIEARIAELRRPLPAFSPPPVARIAEVPYETPEQLRAAADELGDVMGTVRQRLEALEEEERRSRVQERVSRRARGFATDERFLDDGERSRLRPVSVASAGRGAQAGEQPVGGIARPESEALAGAEEDARAEMDDAAPEAAPGAGADWNPPPEEGFGGGGGAPPAEDPGPMLPPPPPAQDPVSPGTPRVPDVAPTPASWPRVVGPEEDDARDRGWDRAGERGGRPESQRDPLAVERLLLEAELRRAEQTRTLLLRRAEELERQERQR